MRRLVPRFHVAHWAGLYDVRTVVALGRDKACAALLQEEAAVVVVYDAAGAFVAEPAAGSAV